MFFISFVNIICSVITIVFLFLVYIYHDCDFLLLWYKWFGKYPEIELRYKTVWITGASSGIGEELALQFSQFPCKLILSARRKNELERVKRQCLKNNVLQCSDILIIQLDLTRFDMHQECLQRIIDNHFAVDLLINNAGASELCSFDDLPISEAFNLVDLNLKSVISLTKTVLPMMHQQNRGHIMTVSSIAGKAGVPWMPVYAATKHAQIGLMSSLRYEYSSQDIFFSTVCLGPTESHLYEHSVTGNQTYPQDDKHNLPQDRSLSTSRCCRLILISIANEIPESWISPHPGLCFIYLMQYLPVIAEIIGRVSSPFRIRAILENLTRIEKIHNSYHPSSD